MEKKNLANYGASMTAINFNQNRNFSQRKYLKSSEVSSRNKIQIENKNKEEPPKSKESYFITNTKNLNKKIANQTKKTNNINPFLKKNIPIKINQEKCVPSEELKNPMIIRSLNELDKFLDTKIKDEQTNVPLTLEEKEYSFCLETVRSERSPEKKNEDNNNNYLGEDEQNLSDKESNQFQKELYNDSFQIMDDDDYDEEAKKEEVNFENFQKIIETSKNVNINRPKTSEGGRRRKIVNENFNMENESKISNINNLLNFQETEDEPVIVKSEALEYIQTLQVILKNIKNDKKIYIINRIKGLLVERKFKHLIWNQNALIKNKVSLQIVEY